MPTMRQLVRAAVTASAIAATSMSAVATSPAAAADIDGHPFSDRIVRDEASLELRGLGRVYYLRIFEIYVGGLYLPAAVGADRVLDDVPKRLELRYSRRVTAADFVEAADEFLRRNYDEATLAPLAPRLERMHSLYRDVEEGDRYALTYLPDRGTELALNGKPVGVIPGADFARVYFGIWLGERPLSSRFKRDVLDGGAL
jgi:hypothetical protein